MTTHKSDAVTAGIMPDFTQAGVVLCRYTEFTSADDSIVSGDTLQLIPIPKYARVIKTTLYHDAMPGGTTDCDIGFKGNADAFYAGTTYKTAGWKFSPDLSFEYVGFSHIFTADDTIDLTFGSMATKLPTSVKINLAVEYVMTGTISDES